MSVESQKGEARVFFHVSLHYHHQHFLCDPLPLVRTAMVSASLGDLGPWAPIVLPTSLSIVLLAER